MKGSNYQSNSIQPQFIIIRKFNMAWPFFFKCIFVEMNNFTQCSLQHSSNLVQIPLSTEYLILHLILIQSLLLYHLLYVKLNHIVLGSSLTL